MSGSAWHGAAQGVRWTATASAVTAALQALQLVVLARLLAPAEFGLFATVAVVTGLTTFVAEAGLGPALVRRTDAPRQLQGTAHAVSLALGLACAALLYGAAAPLAQFYGRPALAPLVQAAAGVFLLQPLGLVFAHLLQRDLAFKALAGVDISTAVVATAVAVAAAALGYGAASLVAAQVAAALVRSLLLLALGVPRYGLQLGFDRTEARYLWRFGAFQIGDSWLGYLHSQLDVLLLGKLAGAEALGLYYAAKQLAYKPLQLINPVVTKVALPAFARVQHEPARLKRGYLAVVAALALVQVPVYGGLCVLAGPVLALVLGPGWQAAAPVLQLLALCMLLRSTINPVGSLLLARGHADRSLYWNLGVLALMAPTLALGAMGGALGMAAASLAAIAVLHVPAWAVLVRPHCGATFAEYFGPQGRRLLAGVLCFAPALLPVPTAGRLALAAAGLVAYAAWHRRELAGLLRPPGSAAA